MADKEAQGRQQGIEKEFHTIPLEDTEASSQAFPLNMLGVSLALMEF